MYGNTLTHKIGNAAVLGLAPMFLTACLSSGESGESGLAGSPGDLFPPPAVLAPQLATRGVNLSKEGLTGLSGRPVAAIVDGLIPLEIVVGLSQLARARRPAADGGVIAGFLEEPRHQLDPRGQADLLVPRPLRW